MPTENLLTVGMAVSDDLAGTFFTVQALQFYQDLSDCEVLVVDNRGSQLLMDWMNYWRRGTYVRWTEISGTSQPRNKVFDFASGKYVICIDPHVLLEKGAVAQTVKWLKANDTDDLFQGPLMYDSGRSFSTHLEPVWRADFWGIWSDTITIDQLNNYKEPYEIPMQGLGLFGAKKETWLRFHEDFRGWGGEEGYIHEKYRKNGRKTVCMPWLRWCHYFGMGKVGSADIESRIRNYLIGFNELGLDLKPIYEHFGVKLVTSIAKNCL